MRALPMSLNENVHMKLAEYTALDGMGLHHLIATREVTAMEVAQAALAAIEAVNPQVNAVLDYWPEEVEIQSAGIVSADPRPLGGVPFLLKDLGVTMQGRRSEMCSRLAMGTVAKEDSYVMTSFRQAGLITLGRTAMPELAVSTTTEPVLYGPTRNPWSLQHGAGGSSGGAGAAVAAGIVPIAHATDGGGSIRVPASCNGLFGLKPTRGRVSNGPHVDEVWNGLGVHFAVSRTVRDSAALLDGIHGGGVGEPYYIAPPKDSYLSEIRQQPGNLKIGFMMNPFSAARADTGVADALSKVARTLESLGHHVHEVAPDLGVSWDAFVQCNAKIWAANAALRINGIAAATGRTVDEKHLEPATLALYRYGIEIGAVELLSALQVRNTVTRALGRFFGDYDILLTPTLPGLAPRIGEYNRVETSVDGLGWIAHVFSQSPFTALSNVTGTPAMSVPLSIDPQADLPIGSHFMSGFGREDTLFRLAAQLEAACPWRERRPPVWAGSIVNKTSKQ
ncbi:putative amidase [Cupriavidus necator H850]|nr:putative amidase [Cupriavidus necator H850]